MILNNRCCFCATIKTGAIIIGTLNLISLVTAAINFDFVQVALRIFTSCWFLMMLKQDSKSRRFAYMVTYLSQAFITGMIELYVFWEIGVDFELQK